MNQDQIAILDILALHAQRPREALERDVELLDLGIDSLKFIVVVLEIEQKLNRQVFDVENVGELRTVGDILELVVQEEVGS